MSEPSDRTLDATIRHRFGDFSLDVAFSIGPGVTALTGPSGAGKSTIVAALAGLLEPDAGRITLGPTPLFDSETGTHVRAHLRRCGVVFQDGRLFPHLTVRGNIAYGRARRGLDRRIDDQPLVALLGIGALLDRRPNTLSGGERQRVAIARALLGEPDVLLMDEPLASLDAARKARVLPYLERLTRETDLPILYVSHDRAEIARLTGRVLHLDRGRLTELPATAAPVTAEVVSGTIVAIDGADMLVRFGDAPPVRLPASPGAAVGGRVRLDDA